MDKNGQRSFRKKISAPFLETGEKKLTVFAQLTIAKSHPFSEAVNGFQISPRMQQLMTYCVQLNRYEKGN